jgi:hypothetical protein
MGELQRTECVAELRKHEREVEELSRALADLGGAKDGGRNERVRREIEFTTARMTKHRISIALIASRLAAA